MLKRLARTATGSDPYGWRAAAVRILANASLVLLAYGAALIAVEAVRVVFGELSTMPAEVWLLFPAFLLIRWLFVLPGLLVVLVGIELVARRVPHARVLALAVALVPMAWWQLTQSGGGSENVRVDTSADLAGLGLTALLFAAFARLPARRPERSTGPGTPESPGEPAVAPR